MPGALFRANLTLPINGPAHDGRHIAVIFFNKNKKMPID
jgi:hypothetical protein